MSTREIQPYHDIAANLDPITVTEFLHAFQNRNLFLFVLTHLTPFWGHRSPYMPWTVYEDFTNLKAHFPFKNITMKHKTHWTIFYLSFFFFCLIMGREGMKHYCMEILFSSKKAIHFWGHINCDKYNSLVLKQGFIYPWYLWSEMHRCTQLSDWHTMSCFLNCAIADGDLFLWYLSINQCCDYLNIPW